MRALVLLAVAAVGWASGCKKDAPKAVPVSAAPAEWKSDLERGDAAMTALASTLVKKLTSAIEQGGPQSAIAVCRDEAPRISQQVSDEQALALGRTSTRLRNPKNAAPKWVEPLLAQAEGKKVKDVQPMAVDLGDRLGMVRPLGVQPLCVTCHGAKERIPEPVQKVLAESYPQDRATGFSEGDFRGFVWVEVPRGP